MEEILPEVHNGNLGVHESILPNDTDRVQINFFVDSNLDEDTFTQHEHNTRKQYLRRRIIELLCEARKLESTNWMFANLT